jgi:menaquinone-dependent protoporphyrinogen IX oxidase
MRSLVVYYSFTGNTRTVAEHAARELDADTAEVRAPRYESGGFRFLRAAFDSWRGRLPAIEVSGRPPEEYDAVLLMAPVWAGHAATPMRAYLAQNRGKLKRAAFLLTCAGSCPPRAFQEMASLAGLEPEATCTLLDREIKDSAGLPSTLASFLASLKLGKTAQV